MSLPKHIKPKKDRRACAPYNFVPLPEKVVQIKDSPPDQDCYYSDLKTGYIDCALTTESLIYVRCAFTPKEFERSEELDEKGQSVDAKKPFREQVRNSSNFFYTRKSSDSSKNPDPVIPGSSLRGMLRTLVEIVSWSKVQWVNDKQIFYRAVGDTTSLGDSYRKRMQQQISGGYCPRAKAGYLRMVGNVYSLTPAKKIHGIQYFRVDETIAESKISDLVRMSPTYRWIRRNVWFQPVPPIKHTHHSRPMYYGKVTTIQENEPTAKKGWERGVFIASGWIPRKHLHWIINAKSNESPIRVSDVDIESYKNGGGITDKIDNEKFSVLPKTDEEIACFYIEWKDREDKQHITIGHTPFFRLSYEKTPIDYVPEYLRKLSDIDLAEAVFGYTREEGVSKARSYASRVFVSDAKLDPPNQNDPRLIDEPIVPKILASPKPTCFQHYLVQKEPDLKLRHYSDPTPIETVIRGYKLYWHKGNVNESDIKEDPQKLEKAGGNSSKQHTQFKPVASGMKFRFRIYFENLSKVELGALMWVLKLPGEEGIQYRHKLGMGKPLGMGAVKIEPTLHITNRQERYKKLFDGDKWFEAFENDSIDYVTEFERYILPLIREKEETKLKDIERIKILLKMLEFPGPSKELTRYMEIEHPTKDNEYKNRPVLPDPLYINNIKQERE